MEIYTTKDLEDFNEKIDDVINDIKREQLRVLDPTYEEIKLVTKIVHDFIIKYKRKIYGGYALNLLLKDKNPKDAIYGDLEIPDIDFYSPDPIVDLKTLCNLLHSNGLQDVNGREAHHKETYTISVNRQNYIDISYVPKNIYHRMPFVEVNKMNMIHPHFMIIDFYRMSTDPLTSYWRIEKMMPRVHKLLTHYPLLKINRPLSNLMEKHNIKNTELKNVLNTVYQYLCNKKSLIVIGFYAYNFFLNESKISNKNSKFFPIDIPYYEFISENYYNDVNELVNILKDTYKDDKFEIKEHYPFFQFYGYNVKVFYNNTLIFWAFDINKKCLPYQEIKLLEKHKGATKSTNVIRIGSFPLVIMMNFIFTIYNRVNKNNSMTNIHQIFTSNLFTVRNNYFRTKHITFLDKSVFQELTIDCIGPKINPQREFFEEKTRKKEKTKRSYTFRYDPSVGNTDTTSTYIFLNSSGNPINHTKNLRLYKKSNDQI